MDFQTSQLVQQNSAFDLSTDINVKGCESDLFVGLHSHDEDIDGLELSLAAKKLGITIDEIWRRIRNGLVLARTHKGQVFVYTDLQSSHVASELPPVPSTDAEGEQTYQTVLENQLHSEWNKGLTSRASNVDVHSLIPVQSHSPELSLLIDHLSLAKEENREILRLTHDSMARLTHMTDSLIEMKNSIIASKEEQMAILKQKIAEQSAQLVEALKEKEDLETLTQALQSQNP